ncbi:hypothetical protein OG474_31250 [Kribbella sp. NBC_01505]|uniref:hypothetical protein n=1 Tax=Kribbella sp. NBC_01505 TaxID=2903580 RepID=UPI00386CFD62
MNPLATQLALSQAAHAARRGELAEALELLEGLESAEAADLRARVLAQLGRWQEADDAWAASADRSPHLHPGTGMEVGASAGRALAQKVLAGRSRQRPVARPLAAAAIAVLAVGGIAVGTASAVNRPAAVVATPQPQPSVAPETVTVTPTEQLDELNRRLAAEKAKAAALDKIAASVAMPGVTVRREPGAVRLVFDRGLFSSGATFAPGSTDLLDRLAPKLKAVPGITVVGQSVAVPGGEASGGSGTALARARVAAQRLAAAGHLPLTRLVLASGDQAQPLFTGEPRNRTVSLLLTA